MRVHLMQELEHTLNEEAEALRWQYPDCASVINQSSAVMLDVTPIRRSDTEQAFVQLRLMFQFPNAYPAEAPLITAVASQGTTCLLSS